MDDEQANILIVDDRPEQLFVLRTVLEELGQNIITATSGEMALKRVLAHDFAVILLDVTLPGSSFQRLATSRCCTCCRGTASLRKRSPRTAMRRLRRRSPFAQSIGLTIPGSHRRWKAWRRRSGASQSTAGPPRRLRACSF